MEKYFSVGNLKGYSEPELETGQNENKYGIKADGGTILQPFVAHKQHCAMNQTPSRAGT